MRRTALLASILALALLPAAANAAAPVPGPASATNIQGVSAQLVGSVDPQGIETSYRFQYVEEAGFLANGFLGAPSTAPAPAGSGSGMRPARATITGLSPSTSYRFRLVATNAFGTGTGTTESFATTQGFGFLAGPAGFSVHPLANGGAGASLAASHPYSMRIEVGLNQGGEFEDQPGVVFPDGDLRDLRIQMPPGLLLNPSALASCSLADFHSPRISPFAPSRSGESCPRMSQVGTVEVATSLEGGQSRRFGVFNLAAAPGVPAQIGFAPYGAPIVLDVGLRANAAGEYTMSLAASDFPQSIDTHGFELVLWGAPWGASHDAERGNCLNETDPEFPWAKCSVGRALDLPPLAYLTMPSGCGPLPFGVEASSWQQPATVVRQVLGSDLQDDPVAIGSCASVPFVPRLQASLTTRKASSASGYNFQLSNEDKGLIDGFTDPSSRAPAPPRSAVVRLPDGVTVNPSVGAGLLACTPGQFAAETAFSAPGEGCPNGARIGDFRVRALLFPDWFEGAVYLAQPDDRGTAAPGAENPFDTLVAIYLVAKLPARGVMVKVAGRLVPDPLTGSLTAVFEGLPQLPYTDLSINFRPGQRSFLISPATCGMALTQTQMTSWGSGTQASFSSGSPIDSGIDGGPCPGAGGLPFAPEAVTGGVNSNVGSYTPYFVRLSRRDTEQEITSYSLILPKGITGKLAGIPFCPEAAIEAARARSGAAEAASPSCPGSSRVGSTLTGYGVGSALTYAPGRIYLAGPYRGSALSLVTINSATVGPFDLGTIVIRSAFAVNQRTAQLQIDSRVSDPIPHILAGIPLHLRDIRVSMDRFEFTHNPSSCEASQMTSTLTGAGTRFDDPADDSTATVSRHFQLLNCLTLGFKPKLGLRLRGGSRRGEYPSLRATFAARGPQDSNLKRIEVTMPHALFLAQEHIRGVCTRVQFDAERCPADSAYGKAVAHTPLFDEPLRGQVYLRSSSNKLPDLVASLRSGSIHIVLEGKIGPAKHGIRVLFDDVPDAPISRFTMTLNGGKRGLLVNSSNICVAPPTASVRALGQNNLGSVFTSELRGQCGKKAGKKKTKTRKGGGR